ncbi:hypothetical protein D1610_06965 [Sphingomonas gilva]|uniref:PBP domain-containing protein n=1 Tax=Sphingomonas gilva TaxID=2305907 RepID=A0A396S472_9SPHN|nr:substrate-binding domain-containing protein [Sphingomonas gilva]RHW18215.1 hypothetical protein D1610_06965 [Sphingomonas gilva]
MRARSVLILAALVTADAVAAAAAGEGSPYPAPAAAATCALVASGNPADHDLITALEAGFRNANPRFCIDKWLHGPESTLAPVYTGTADIAFMAREVREPMERMAFEWVALSKPFAIDYAYAGLKDDRPGTQLAIFVHRDNPVKGLTLAQLDAILGAEHKRGDGNARDWGAIGLAGSTARPIEVLGPPVDSIPALFIRRLVMKDSRKWNPAYQEVAEAGAILPTLAGRPNGLAIAPAHAAHPMTRMVPLAAGPGDPFVLPEPAAIRTGIYPLTRIIQVVVKRAQGAALEQELRAFLEYLLSPAGQAIIARDGSYLPLDQARLAQQRARLK